MSRLTISVACLTLAALFLTVGCSGDQSISALGGGAKSEVALTIIPKTGGGPGGGGTAAVEVAGYGHVKGRITISGAVPSLPPLVSASQVKPADKDVCVLAKIPNQKLVVNGNAVTNVFVYLSKAPAGGKELQPAEAEVVMDHDACTFVPHAMVVQAGQDLRILNADAIAHNVHTYPKRNGSYNSGIGPNERTGITTSYRLGEREPVKVACDYHTWMLAWHLPLDHPYGAVSDENGEFEIRDLPAGKHRLTIWHEGAKLADKDVTVEVDQTAPLDVEFTAADFKVAHENAGPPRTVVLSFAH